MARFSFSEDNLFGRAWRTTSQVTYGQYGVLLDLAFHDPWIKGRSLSHGIPDERFSSAGKLPLQFRTDEGSDIRVVEDYHEAPNPTTNQVFLRSNSRDPQTENLYQTDGDLGAPGAERGQLPVCPASQWRGSPCRRRPLGQFSAGLAFQEVTIQNADGDAEAYAKGPPQARETTDNFFCVGHDCEPKNFLAGVRFGVLYNTLNEKVNPTSGNFASFSTEQYISVGKGSPTFNRSQVSLAHFIPVNLLKLYRGCRPGPGEPEDCPQTLAFQVTGGTLLGDAPPYESFCLGGSTSVRGFSECAIGPGTTFGEASIEYRFPIFGIVSGALFTDAGSVLGSQSSVTGNPGELLDKPDSGFSYGVGAVLNTPLGPLRLEVAKGNHKDDWGLNFGVGWKF